MATMRMSSLLKAPQGDQNPPVMQNSSKNNPDARWAGSVQTHRILNLAPEENASDKKKRLESFDIYLGKGLYL